MKFKKSELKEFLTEKVDEWNNHYNTISMILFTIPANMIANRISRIQIVKAFFQP